MSSLIISPVFHASAQFAAANYTVPDTMLLSSNGVIYYVHAAVLMNASFNGFGGLLPNASADGASAMRVEDDSHALDIIFYTVYGLDIAPLAADWPTLTHAVSTLIMRYGLLPPGPGDPLFAALLAHVHQEGGAKQVYAFAAQHELEALAVESSAHLLSLALQMIDPVWVTQVGPEYMRRLYFLQLGRIQAFSRILPAPLQLHPPTVLCDEREMQEMVLSPWAYAVANLVTNPQPGTQPAAIEAALNPIAYRTPCAQCAEAVRRRIEDIVQEWSAVKVLWLPP
ncbi:hypothetical protein AURDEDRAFT_164089 [Auricularia subglabra TFB-10046 SS5]|nr:hypothetical protein AURDEDRAFT_164089 [Auricularia subglabra TFB-10046 SS5]